MLAAEHSTFNLEWHFSSGEELGKPLYVLNIFVFNIYGLYGFESL